MKKILVIPTNLANLRALAARRHSLPIPSRPPGLHGGRDRQGDRPLESGTGRVYFRPWKEDEPYRVKFQFDAQECSSPVGKVVNANEQIIKITYGCPFDQIVHEMGVAVGSSTTTAGSTATDTGAA